MKVSELSGKDLDYWVGKARGYNILIETMRSFKTDKITTEAYQKGCPPRLINPSTDWAQGGPLIAKYDIWLSSEGDGKDRYHFASIQPHMNENIQEGKTALEAAMRVLVASKYGEYVDE